ncbi:formylglycine-generating enzyme family protein [Enterovibrio calviensis]|uniref:formylglycine-generating enzyme family protein n=1 Tax=Enterovibrio calviensis TaxID=91359 RepID=UPI003736EBD5
MKSLGLLILIAPFIASCGDASSTPPITSDAVSQERISEIQQNIERLYPDKDENLKREILDVAVRAIDDIVFVEGGTFMMGDFKAPCDPVSTERMDWTPEAKCFSSQSSLETGASYLHEVTLDSFYLSKFETRLLDFDVYFQVLDLPFLQYRDWQNDLEPLVRFGETYNSIDWKDLPAKTKDWIEAKNYCLWLGGISNMKFDLPSEAQWEFAARSRGENVYYATNNGYLQQKGGYYYDEELDVYLEYTEQQWNYSSDRKIGLWPPNPLGFFDMAGNSGEWVNDWYSPEYYKISPKFNPKGPDSGEMKVLRGAVPSKTMVRTGLNPNGRDYSNSTGFRCSIQEVKLPLLIKQ